MLFSACRSFASLRSSANADSGLAVAGHVSSCLPCLFLPSRRVRQKDTPGDRHEKLQPTQGVASSSFLLFLLFFSPTLTFTFSVSPPLCRLAYSLQLHLLTVSSHLLNNPPPSRAWHSTGTPPPLLHTTPLSSPSRLHLPISLVDKGKIQRYSSVPCLTYFRSFLTVLTIPGFPPNRF